MKQFGRIIFVAVVFLFVSIICATGQTIKVTGKVFDASTNETVVGASVLIKGTTTGTVTSLDGDFSISASKGQTIVVSSIGYTDYTFTVSDSSPMTIKMQASSEFLQDVVVVGYGAVKKENLTGAVDQVSSEIFEGRPVSNTSQMLVGAIPNLNINIADGKPGRSADYNIRGTTSIGGGGSALVLIDGVEGDPALVNPDDIESVSVLKDAASASIYGSRATFGVVLITTKSASKEDGKFTINYSGNVAFLSPINLPDIIDDGYVYASLFAEAYSNFYCGVMPSGINSQQAYSQQWMDDFRRRKMKGITEETTVDAAGNYVYYGNTNYYKVVYKPYTTAQTHNISASGSTGKLNYYVSARFYNYDGIFNFNPDKYTAANVRAKATMQLFKWLSLSENIDFSYDKKHIPATTNQTNQGNFLRSMQDAGHVSSPVFNPDGTLTRCGAEAIGGLVAGTCYTDKLVNSFKTTTKLNAKFFDNTWRVNFDFSWAPYWSNNTKKNTTVSYSPGPGQTVYVGTPGVNDFIDETYYNKSYIVTNAYTEYENTFGGKHYFKALLGFNYEESLGKTTDVLRYGLLTDDVQNIQLALGDSFTTYGTDVRWKTMGFFGRLNYAYDERYLLEINGRYDGSSKFPTNSQWGFFPSVSAAWRVSKEHFWHVDPKVMNNLKLRFSYGELGNGNMAAYSFMEKFALSNLSAVIDGQALRRYTSIPSQIPDNLTWETVRTIDGGIDLGFYSGKINFSADYYVRKTLNMYTVGPSLPDTYGASAPKGNYADLSTYGWELSLSYNDSFTVGTHPLNVGAKVTLADNRSYIDRYNNPSKSLSDYYEGQEVGEIWGYKFDGFFSSQTQIDNYYGAGKPYVNDMILMHNGYVNIPGDVIIKDLNGNQIIDVGANTVDNPGDLTIVGNKSPRYMYSMNFDLEWNGIYATIMFQGVGKRDWYPSGESIIWGQYHRPYGNALKWTVNNAWTQENQDAYLPIYTGWSRLFFTGANKVDRYVMDASYLRLKNLQIGWNLPTKWTKKIGLAGIGIYFSGENLYTWSPLYDLTTDVDVVTAPNGGDQDLVFTSDNLGDGNSVPSMRTFSFGITLKL